MKKTLTVLLIALFAVSITAIAQEKVEEKQEEMKKESKEYICKKVCMPCGAEIEDKSEAIEYEYKEKTFYFCCEKCLEAFKEDPEKWHKIAREWKGVLECTRPFAGARRWKTRKPLSFHQRKMSWLRWHVQLC